MASIRSLDDVAVLGERPPALRLVLDPASAEVEASVQPLVRPVAWHTRASVRAFDLAVAIPAAIVLLPVMAIVAVLVSVTSRGPVIYRNRRVTRGGAVFPMLKFRSMVSNGDEVLAKHFAEFPERAGEYAKNRKLTNDPRITRVGRFIRRTSLDELPQLFNVIGGTMSIVGPRPMLEEELDMVGHHGPELARVKGGCTGLWQISGRNLMTFDERIPLDLHYIRNRSLSGDVQIVARTAGHLLTGSPGAF